MEDSKFPTDDVIVTFCSATDPELQNGSIKEVEVSLYFQIENNCTVETNYRRTQAA